MSQQDRVQEIRLSKLAKSPDNVRRTPPGEAEQDRLKASIDAHGLLQPLVVRPGSRKGQFEVVAGGCRLDALKTLQKEKKLPRGHAVPCIVRAETGREASLAENLQRTVMHPADEFEAFAGLIDQGAEVEDIARRFGVTAKHVRQRLKLGKAAPELIQAYRDKEIDLDVLMAFTVSDDHDAQRSAWAQVKDHCHVSPYSVKRLLTENTIAADSRLGRFVGIEDYEKAGGHMARDLFTDRDEGYFTDTKLVRELASKKLQAKAKELEAEWKWARSLLEPDLHFASDYVRVYPKPVDPPNELVEELETLTRRFDEIEALPDEAWTDELADESERVEERRAELVDLIENSAEFAPEDQVRSGCLVTIGPDGGFQIHAGLIPREEAAESAAQDRSPVGNKAPASESREQAAQRTREQSLRKEFGIAQTHLEDLKAHRLQITKAHLARDYETAFDAALYSLCMGVIRVGHFANPLDLRANPTRPTSSLNDLGGTAAEVQLKAVQDGLALSWMNLPPAEAFAAMCSLSAEEKQGLFAWCVTQSLEGQLSIEDRANPVIERLGARLGIDFANYWRPTADNYWSRVKKDHALDVGAEILGKQWRRDFSKAKKAELANVLERAFDSETSAGMALDEEARARAAKWLPAGFVFEPDVGQAEQTEADIDPVAGDQNETALPEFLTGSENQPTAAE